MAEENNLTTVVDGSTVDYNDDNIRTLSGTEHIRLRPGMYIGRLGDGSLAEDGIYVLLKEVIDNSIDEFKMKAGDRIEINVDDNLRVSVRDYGRGIPQGKMIEAVSVLNTGGKYDSKAFKKSIGLNGVGVKAVNALSSHFEVHSYRDGQVRKATFEKGKLVTDTTEPTDDENGTYIYFEPDNTLFINYQFHNDIVENMLRNYTYLNTGLAIMYNGRRILSRRGLEDLLKDRMSAEALYPIIHLQGEDIEIAFTHANQHSLAGRGYRDSVHPCQPVWRGVLLFRQWSAHHARRYTPECLQGTYRQDHQGVLPEELRVWRYPHRYRGCYRPERRGTDVRESDED